MNIRNYIENNHMLSENRLPSRSMLIPASVRGITPRNFEKSDRVTLLSGDWKFRWLPENDDSEFFRADFSEAQFDDVKVPSMWQYQGYGLCKYPNVQFPFPYDPPYIHRDNPVGLYRKSFTAKKSEKTILRFMGVGGAYFVWLNGEYVGFSKGSRIASEFDVTDKLHDGENLLAVKVFTWSDASYLENQDMLLANGIIRDVYLVGMEKEYLWDYTIVPEADGFRLFAESVGKLSAELYDADGNLMASADDCGEEVFLKVEKPRLWNAEDPYLYELVLRVGNEVHTKRIGMRFSEVVGNKLLLNGKPIRLKGVNRHDNNCHTGQAITREQILSELCDIKSCNLNAIRNSHYPRDPVFYEYASELGIYVMDEADLETHGCEVTGDQGALNKNPDWYDAFFDRVYRMYSQDKNETCVNIWSLGNECGKGDSYDKISLWLRGQRVRKPIHFSCAGTIPEAHTDFRETGYMSMATLKSFGTEGRPVLMVEYAHAMGNSPGGLEDIWNHVYHNEQYAGGYVWEFKSHGFYVEGKDGKPRYLYGGDFEDLYHWSNFSLDGFHTSDGTPKPSWDELREVSAPIFIDREEDGIRVSSSYDFTTISGATVDFSVIGYDDRSGEVTTIRHEIIPLADIPPRGSAMINPDLGFDDGFGHVSARLLFTMNGKQLGDKQIILRDEKVEFTGKSESLTETHDESGNAKVKSGKLSLEFAGGLLSKLEKDGKILIDEPMRLNLWRAYTDNDGIEKLFPRRMGEWRGALVHTARFGFHEWKVDGDRLVAVGKLLPQGYFWGFDVEIAYEISDGVKISVHGKPYGRIPGKLPRIGIMFGLLEDYTTCEWFGRGEGDSYSDRRANSHFGVFRKEIPDLNFIYDVPQETGNHENCRRVTLSGKDLSLTATGSFAFSCHDFSLENLTAARHYDELCRGGKKYLYLDYKMRPLGSASCGPEPEPEYELTPEEFTFDVKLG